MGCFGNFAFWDDQKMGSWLSMYHHNYGIDTPDGMVDELITG